jgi:hypothetical protein
VIVVRFGEPANATGTGDSRTTADPEDDLVPQPASAASLQNL